MIDLDNQEIPSSLNALAEKQGFGFLNALKCRWMRKQPEWNQLEWERQTQNCLFNIEQQRALIGAPSFDEFELAQLNEQRYEIHLSKQPIGTPFNRLESWNKQYFESQNGITHLKTWLDQGGDVLLEDK